MIRALFSHTAAPHLNVYVVGVFDSTRYYIWYACTMLEKNILLRARYLSCHVLFFTVLTVFTISCFVRPLRWPEQAEIA